MSERIQEGKPPPVSRLRLGTELERIAEQLKLLARAQDELHELYEAVLSREVELSVVLELIVSTAMELVGARYGALGVLDANGENLALFVPVGLSEQERADLAGVEHPRGRGLLGHLITHPAPLRVDGISGHPDSAGFPPGHPAMRTLLGAPISIRGKIYGDLYLSERRDGRPFDGRDEGLIVALAGAAALAIDDARLYEQTRRDAERFQRLLLPRLPDDLEPFEAAAAYSPATTPGHVGGDWYDALLVPEKACAAVIGDVVGHDLQAAAAMAQTRNMLRALLYDRRTSPSVVLTHLDRTLQAITENPVTTACLARIEPAPSAGWTLRWSTAGHPPPLLITPDRWARYLPAEPDLPLGIDTSRRRHDHTHPLPTDATVVFFTDGLVEHRDHSFEVGLQRLAVIATAHANSPLADLVHTLIDEHPSDGHDDMAVLAIRTPHT
ncbi:SpoIIE family protein phosphatase [Streptomyces sp. NBC_01340]|uniref:PP2C family protein-serine/threonine phosphatase n=1 Tax=unclassified Streptomyces TaxID=2593676 RepID=UPI00224FCD59|nr:MULTISPECIES: GAF domain-containing SpoIIE family protein phosphatase [unclassified Streptomyces]MCX4458917.1 SpoIIE family protein phosphatase [Streptomyces sp. NBC_01719]MCX4498274.1 SpoIIE family protein phosphatase [Streptomyces sp. NBC_01728]MCX4595858.1 SpoIIE family protein phosphatase [Streptomyces sp. NBC_01549]WSI42791.1 SpoIIE family protein phosphatase [Streptomyces sp. NBC_01340]